MLVNKKRLLSLFLPVFRLMDVHTDPQHAYKDARVNIRYWDLMVPHIIGYPSFPWSAFERADDEFGPITESASVNFDHKHSTDLWTRSGHSTHCPGFAPLSTSFFVQSSSELITVCHPPSVRCGFVLLQ